MIPAVEKEVGIRYLAPLKNVVNIGITFYFINKSRIVILFRCNLIQLTKKMSLFAEQQAQPIHHPPDQEQDPLAIEDSNYHKYSSFAPPILLKLLIGYLYFIQGVIVSLPDTMTMVYPELPSYETLSVFSAASAPFSIKFIVAPFIEKFTTISYGKRKTWIIISQMIASFLLMLASFFTGPSHQIKMALFLIAIVFLITLQDISLDALAIKELRTPHLVGFLQAIMQTSGGIIGSLLLLKLTSRQFAANIGLSEPICHPSLIFRVVSLIFFFSTLFIHIVYEETTLKSQRTVIKKGFCEILKYYRVFFDTTSKYCRITLIFLIYIQGFNLFQAGYEYELIKSGFKRNTFNTILNLTIIPNSILACLFCQKIQKFGILKSFLAFMILKETLVFFIVSFFPTDILPICIIYFFGQGLDIFRSLIISILVNSFPVNGISGMLFTMLVSGANFGALKTFPLILTGKIGWRACASIGLIVQLLIISIFPLIFRKAEEGSFNLDAELSQQDGKMQEVLDQEDQRLWYVSKANIFTV